MRDRPTKDPRPFRRSGRPPDRKDAPRGKPSPRTAAASKPTGKLAARPRPAPTQAAEARGEEGGARRIAKVMARAGLCSRRTAEAWIADGRVGLNGAPVTDPAVNVGEADKITVDGEPLARQLRTRLFLFHKPRGLVSTERDPEGRPTIFDYLREHWPDGPRVVSIGRLDINTEGLLLLTNDGGLARILELPSTGWVRRYRVRAKGETDQSVLDRLREGVTVEGVNYAGIEATLDRAQGANSWLTLALREGKNREIKRVLEQIGLTVNRLIRLSFGPFQLGELAEGAVEEVRTRVLRDQLGPSLAKAAGVDFLSPSAPDASEGPAPVEDRRVRRARETRAPRSEARGKPEARPRKPMSLHRSGDGARQSGARAPDPERGAAQRPRKATRPQEKRDAAPEARGKPEARPRKHISVLRAGDGADQSGTRKRIERRETADRSGRTVQVERLVPAETGGKTRDTLRLAASRNSRRFEAERKSRDGEAARPARRGPASASRPKLAADGAPERKRTRFDKPGAQSPHARASERIEERPRRARPAGGPEGGRARTPGATAGKKTGGKGGFARGSRPMQGPRPGKGRPRDKS